RLCVLERLAARDLQVGVIAPRVGIADADDQARDLRLGALLRLRGHPRQRVDAMPERAADVGDYRLQTIFRFGRKIFGDVHLADRWAHCAVGGVDGALPSIPLLRGAVERLAVALATFLGERLRQY